MSWANQRVYDSIRNIPATALDSFVVNPEWTAGRILEHIVSGADWYVYCLTGQKLVEFEIPQSLDDVEILATELAKRDALILTESLKDDELLTIQMDERVAQHFRSTIISQAIHHATEHRAQLIDALESRRHAPINLDDIDVWAHEYFEKTRT